MPEQLAGGTAPALTPRASSAASSPRTAESDGPAAEGPRGPPRTVEAAATVIRFLGASIVEDKCRELLAKSRSAEEAADAAGVDHADLTRAAGELEEAAGEEGRLLAVVKLRDASAALEGALDGEARAQLGAPRATRAAAASLARYCRDYLEAAEGMRKVMRAKEDGADCRASGSWWSALWRWRRRHQGLRENLLAIDVETGGQPKETLDAADVDATIDVLSEDGMRQLEAAGRELLVQARGVITAADAARVPRRDLSEAAEALAQARDPAARLDCVNNLGSAAAAVEGADSAPLKAVRDRAADLVRACRELKEAAEAMARVQRAAAELRERRGSGAWRSCVFGRRGRRNEQREEALEGGPAAAVAVAVQPGLGQGEERRSAMASLALYGSLTLITYLGPGTVEERVKLLPPKFRSWFHAGLSVWWTLQSVGVPCSAYARSLLELRCAQVMCRLGMLGVNGFVIVFVYLALGIHNKLVLGLLLAAACLVHFIFFLAAGWQGHLSK